jgi:EmrB/QacA subfamily drug resistance transporter
MVVAGIVACAFFMETLDSTVIVTALPRMAEAFHTDVVSLSLGLTAYVLTLAIVIPASGWFADRFGTRNVFCAAIAVFTLASILCGLCDTTGEFVAARILQGIGGAMMSPVGRLVALRSTSRTNLVRVMNFVTMPGLIGPVIGPPVGGFITTYLSWRYIFFLNVPVGILGMALVWRLIGNYRAERRPFDAAGFVVNGVALASLIYGMNLLSERGAERSGAVLAALGILLGVAAVYHALRGRHPLVELSAFRARTFNVANTGGSFFRLAIAAPAFVMPLLFQIGLGMSAFVSGLLLLFHAAGDLGAKLITTQAIRRHGFRSVLIWTSILFALTTAACAGFTRATPLYVILPILFVSGVCRSLQMTAQNTFQFAEIGPEAVTSASTLSSVLLQVVRAIGIAASALLLNVAATLRGAPAVSLPDFHLAFVAISAVALLSLIWYWPLEHGSGAELSGHRAKTP